MLHIARELFDLYIDATGRAKKIGESRMAEETMANTVIGAACVVYAMRDRNEGAMMREEVCERMLFLERERKEFMFIVGDMRDRLIQKTSISRHRHLQNCLTRDLTIHDILVRMLRGIMVNTGNIDSDHVQYMRRFVFKMEDKLKGSGWYSDTLPQLKFSAMIFHASEMLNLPVSVNDVAKVGYVSVKALSDEYSKLMNLVGSMNNKRARAD